MRRGLSAALHFERTNAKLLAAHALRTAMRIAHLVRGDVTTAREYAERGLRLALLGIAEVKVDRAAFATFGPTRASADHPAVFTIEDATRQRI